MKCIFSFSQLGGKRSGRTLFWCAPAELCSVSPPHHSQQFSTVFNIVLLFVDKLFLLLNQYFILNLIGHALKMLLGATLCIRSFVRSEESRCGAESTLLLLTDNAVFNTC